MTINGIEHNGILAETKDRVSVAFNDNTTVLDCAEIGEDPTIVSDGKTIDYLGKIISIMVSPDNGQVICTWEIELELDRVQEELKEAQQEIQERDFTLDRIRQAIKDLGSGIPTLSKLMTFLSTVKEALNYD